MLELGTQPSTTPSPRLEERGNLSFNRADPINGTVASTDGTVRVSRLQPSASQTVTIRHLVIGSTQRPSTGTIEPCRTRAVSPVQTKNPSPGWSIKGTAMQILGLNQGLPGTSAEQGCEQNPTISHAQPVTQTMMASGAISMASL